MEGLKTLKGCGEFLIHNDKDDVLAIPTTIRQAQCNTTLQKHTKIILKSIIFGYPHKVSLF